jgi:hypothetical protein
MLHLYLETNIWNALSKQGVDAKALLNSLARKNATLVLSPHTVYELARTFTGKKPAPKAQGIKLFSCVKAFLDLDIPCSKELMEFLRDEVLAYRQGGTAIDPLLHGSDRADESQEVDKLANGIVEDRVLQFIAQRTQHAKKSRADQVDHFADRQEVKEKLQKLPESKLSEWLTLVTTARAGGEALCSHLERMFAPAPTIDDALALLRAPVARAARALVRADLYSNWRCANRNSNPFDLMDDMLHVLQATYSDVYVTAEKKQSDYASLLLDHRTRVAIYDGRTPVDLWLEGLC